MQFQSNNQFIQFAKQLLEQPSSSSPEQDDHKESSVDVSELILIQHTINNNQILASPEPQKKKIQMLLPSDEPCYCSKSSCRKMYCECLAKGRLCSQLCRCKNCHNRSANKLVLNVMEELHQNKQRKRFRSRRFKDGCTCQKSMCLKKYCECFNSGKGCGSGCRCLDCGNYNLNNEKIEWTPCMKKTSKFTSKFESANTNTRSDYYDLILEKLILDECEENEEYFEKMNTIVIMKLGQLII